MFALEVTTIRMIIIIYIIIDSIRPAYLHIHEVNCNLFPSLACLTSDIETRKQVVHDHAILTRGQTSQLFGLCILHLHGQFNSTYSVLVFTFSSDSPEARLIIIPANLKFLLLMTSRGSKIEQRGKTKRNSSN